MGRGGIREFFPGGNTYRGFYSFYDYILPRDARRIIILKGGPGVGKSTLMRKIGEEILSRGYNVELHCCSSDNNSIDGIVVPFAEIGIIDGTAPHVVDPHHPGAVDEIIHLGDYWNEKELRKYKKEVMSLNNEVGRLFKQAYLYLFRAKTIKDEMQSFFVNSDCFDVAAYNSYSRYFRDEIFNGVEYLEKQGKARHLFASAITPGGFVNCFNSIFKECERRFIIKSSYESPRNEFICWILKEMAVRGYDMEIFHCALEPEKVEHFIVPELRLAVISSVRPHDFTTEKNDIVWDLDILIDNKKRKPFDEDLSLAEDSFWSVLNHSVGLILRAKKAHDEMEKYYIPSMDFEKIENVKKKILTRFLSYITEAEEEKTAKF